jgi:holo-[acyl-carrier protein] synthase
MIAGLGIDLVEIERFAAAVKRQGPPFLQRLFTAAERRYCDGHRNRMPHYSARFAAKEAVLKALGTGWSGGIRWTDVEILREKSGPVKVRLSGRARKAASEKGIRRVHLSITHAESHAAAIAVAET